MHQDRPHPEHDSNCALCADFTDFELPHHLLDRLLSKQVVIFAGAGVSTEVGTVFPTSLYDEVHWKLGLRPSDKPPFPDLMSQYCLRPDGRRLLLEHIHSRFEYVRAFPELYRTATRFHRELSSLFFINTIITTNWDDYFERETGAIPMVTPDDYSLWNVNGRKVFKLHGSVNNLGSIVVTNEDYSKAQRRLQRGVLGSTLKTMLATKTVVYVGYSFRDHDFNAILKFVKKELAASAPTAYAVSPDDDSIARFSKLGLTTIHTDGTYFLEVLKRHLVQDGHLLPDEVFADVTHELAKVEIDHDRLYQHYRSRTTPGIIFAASYQDGLIHSFERILSMRHAGEYSHSCAVVSKLKSYEALRAQKVSARRYADVAYIDGYMNGLVWLLLDTSKRRLLPHFYVYGLQDQPRTFSQYRRAVPKQEATHKTAAAFARRLVDRGLRGNTEFHHTPFLG